MIKRKQYDVVLPPIKVEKPNRIARFLGLTDLNNWAYSYLKIDTYERELIKQAKRDIYIFVLDTAGRFDNKYLTNYIDNSLGKDFTDDETPEDYHGHGTHVAGCIAADHPEYLLGLASLLKGKLKIVPIKVLNKNGSGQYEWIKNGLQYVRELDVPGVKLVNMSFGGNASNTSMEIKIKYMLREGIFFCAAAGNSGSGDGERDTIQFPGRIDGILGIGAHDDKGIRAHFSSVGAAIDLIGPGVNIPSTYKNNSIVRMSGTSMASPTVCAIMAWLLSINDNITKQEQLNKFVFDNITDLGAGGWDKLYGHGTPIIEPYIDETPEPPSPDPDPNPNPEPEPEPPIRSKTLVLPIQEKFTVKYKLGNKGSLKTIKLQLTLTTKSNKFAETVYEELNNWLRSYFSRSFLQFREDSGVDIYIVAYYVNRFLGFRWKAENMEVEVVSMLASNTKGHTILLENPSEVPAPAMKIKEALQASEIYK
jgi:major intracellular serine protease